MLPVKVNPEIWKDAAVAPLFDTPTSKASDEEWVMVGFEPITFMFLFDHETGLDHEHEPAGT